MQFSDFNFYLLVSCLDRFFIAFSSLIDKSLHVHISYFRTYRAKWLSWFVWRIVHDDEYVVRTDPERTHQNLQKIGKRKSNKKIRAENENFNVFLSSVQTEG